MNLNHWISQARDHWKQHQPTLFAQLKAKNQLGNALREAAEKTYQEVSELEAQGFSEHEAFEMTREKYLFPPEEASLQDSETNPAATRMQDVMRIVNSQYEDSDQPQEQ